MTLPAPLRKLHESHPELCAESLSDRLSDSSVSVPQFFCFNAVLRKFPTELCERMGSFTTTIFVLISSVQKVARIMKLPEGLRLYRGMGGLMALPQKFFHSDPQGRKGFVEWGFMSTTSDLKVGKASEVVRSNKWCRRCLWVESLVNIRAVQADACLHHRNAC